MKRIVRAGFFIGAILALCSACIVSRLSRPAIYGTVADYSGRPIVGCKIAEATTDSAGKFFLKEKRYCEFTAPGMEAPSLHFGAELTKDGYKPIRLRSFSMFGGGSRRGAKWELDTLFMLKENESIPLGKILYQDWTLSATKRYDTLYCVTNGGYGNTIVEGEQDFYEIFRRLRGDEFNRKGNLPDSVINRVYGMTPSQNGAVKLQRVEKYKTGTTKQLVSDTIRLTGTISVAENMLSLKSNIAELNGSYKAYPNNRKQMMLVRTTEFK